jgi:phosphotransferase system enzyme I (PtsI)
LKPILPEDVTHEVARWEHALDVTREQIEMLKVRLAEQADQKDVAIFDAHLLFLEDPLIHQRVEKLIREQLYNAEQALHAVVSDYLAVMDRVADPYLQARKADIQDVSHRVVQNLMDLEDDASTEEGIQHVLLAQDLTPSDTAAMDVDQVLGFATELGSTVSHTAILARSMGIPAIVGIPNLMEQVAKVHAEWVIVDGYKGLLIINPEQSVIAEYRKIQNARLKEYEDLASQSDLRTETVDGHYVKLAVNVEFPHEVGGIEEVGAEGVGLFRTEFFLLGNDTEMPNEEVQTKSYSELVKACNPHEVIFRTLDSGGDKLPTEHLDSPEPNPFLGWRGIRVSLSRKEMFKDQLKAILRASVNGPTGVMFPMISGLTEVRRAKKVLAECREELDAAGVPYGKDLKVGIMIEVPSAAMLADVLANEVDFFSIGTNDLTQYTIAVDRVNSHVAHMFRPTHPGVIRMIDMTVKAGKAKGITTTICGEVAGDILLLPLMIGLGADELSVGVHLVPVLRYAIRCLDYSKCQELAKKALLAPDSNTVLKLSSELAHSSYPKLFK